MLARSHLKTAANPQNQAVPGHRSQVPTLHSAKCTSAQCSTSWQDSRALFHFCASEVVEVASTPVRLRVGFRQYDGALWSGSIPGLDDAVICIVRIHSKWHQC